MIVVDMQVRNQRTEIRPISGKTSLIDILAMPVN
jgi:hypothetical protein